MKQYLVKGIETEFDFTVDPDFVNKLLNVLTAFDLV